MNCPSCEVRMEGTGASRILTDGRVAKRRRCLNDACLHLEKRGRRFETDYILPKFKGGWKRRAWRKQEAARRERVS